MIDAETAKDNDLNLFTGSNKDVIAENQEAIDANNELIAEA